MLTEGPLGEHTNFSYLEILGKFWTQKWQVLMLTKGPLGEPTSFDYLEILG